jgi:hypothetical protein
MNTEINKIIAKSYHLKYDDRKFLDLFLNFKPFSALIIKVYPPLLNNNGLFINRVLIDKIYSPSNPIKNNCIAEKQIPQSK